MSRLSTSSSVALWAAVAVLVGIIWSVMFTTPWRLPADDGVRPAWVGHCGNIPYRWHYDPRTTPSGSDCVIERVEQ